MLNGTLLAELVSAIPPTLDDPDTSKKRVLVAFANLLNGALGGEKNVIALATCVELLVADYKAHHKGILNTSPRKVANKYISAWEPLPVVGGGSLDMFLRYLAMGSSLLALQELIRLAEGWGYEREEVDKELFRRYNLVSE